MVREVLERSPLEKIADRMREQEPHGYCRVQCDDNVVDLDYREYETVAKALRQDVVLHLRGRYGDRLALWIGDTTAVVQVTPDVLERQVTLCGDEGD